MTRVAKGTLLVSCIISSLVIWGVHFQQSQEREVRDLLPFIYFEIKIWQNLVKTMYQGVLRDDERRREKMKKRADDLQESLRKREQYERVQSVTSEHCLLHRKGSSREWLGDLNHYLAHGRLTLSVIISYLLKIRSRSVVFMACLPVPFVVVVVVQSQATKMTLPNAVL